MGARLQRRLAEIIVRRDREGRGMGSALAREFIARCGAGHVYCEALAGREPFFEKLGFQARPRLSAMSWRR
ncbi:hypothetical protein CXB49_22335 [Chromobacterium sp. ATCC 53434]|uniref:GNAT family N-acetyltransferase n=1 Tax=Chromobacterium TaxID=535 RepID=UPI000C76A054|nr:GNAT family N-acetyltransferase [Chromobacterium sp. ATCC 53434]AUH53319.1 hypothetical protein CXB49_22335 [Chromobacterium sp. ATCC 53434]